MHQRTEPDFISIPFGGTRSGSFPLTWGQRWIWNSLLSRAPYFADLSGSYVVTVPETCGIDGVAGALTALLARYETLRTMFSVDPDGKPHQLVPARGRLRVEVRDVGPDLAEGEAETVRTEFDSLPFTLPEVGLRAAVISMGGVPSHVVLCVFHLAMDCGGMTSVLGDFRSLLEASDTVGVALPEARQAHPVDRLAEELSVSGVRRSARGIRFWEQELAKFPAEPLLRTHRPDRPRYQTFGLRSAALQIASRHLAAELTVSTGSVVLATAASLLGLRTGHRTVGFVLMASHRYAADAMGYRGTLAQGVPVALDTLTGSPRHLMSAAHRTSMLAALSGHCDPDELAERLHERYGPSARARLSCVANLHVAEAGDTEPRTRPKGSPSVRAWAESLRAESQCAYVTGTSVESESFYLAIRGDAADFSLRLRADTAVFTAADCVRFLQDLERSVIDCLPGPR